MPDPVPPPAQLTPPPTPGPTVVDPSPATPPSPTPTPPAPEPPKTSAGKDGEAPKTPPEPPKAPEAPPTIDIKTLKLPEGFTPSEEAIKGVVATLLDDKLAPQARTEKLLELHHESVKAAVQGPIDYWAKTNLDWRKEIASDKDFGTGDEKAPLRAEHVVSLAKVLTFLGGDEFKHAMFFTGAGNHPAVVRGLLKLVPLVTESSVVPATPPTASQPTTAADALYGHLRKG